MTRNHFVYRLIPPRPTFAMDMSEAEQAIMGQHAVYWTDLFEQGRAALFGVVMDQSGAWGLAVVEAEAEEEVHGIAADDPAVTSGLCTVAIGLMPQATVRPRHRAA